MTTEPVISAPHDATSAANGLAGRLVAMLKALQGFASKYRAIIVIVAVAVFVGGLAYSAASLDLRASDLSLPYILLSAGLIIPIAFLYGALNFMVMARGAGQNIAFWPAFKVSCVAQFAEFLPIPGGAIVRGGALVRDGSGAANAAAHVMINALLWVACAALAAGLALGLDGPIALLIACGGLAGVVACTGWLWAKAGLPLAMAALAMRIVGLGIAGLRILAGFLVISVPIAFFDLYPFVFAAILGSAAAIAPGGLGISEAVAAAIATLSTIPPEAAFLAVAINRLIGFAVSGIATAIITFLPKTEKAAA
ncbi:hypothetical protein [Erythrobacter crassostreae]|uniref:Uncharacterized protein n=1 Tax=Erythrobacter crassostreae TaxID=2828328 RepID=A0A9X1JMJ2_9SPHN|nr:hypothetical protein [Erythrobacter crassostrea]MBV7259479.1 hypothetical protein [Erythrobacter crassostrea]